MPVLVIISVVEWPGGGPATMQLKVDLRLLTAIKSGLKSVPFGSERLKDFAELPWDSPITGSDANWLLMSALIG